MAQAQKDFDAELKRQAPTPAGPRATSSFLGVSALSRRLPQDAAAHSSLNPHARMEGLHAAQKAAMKAGTLASCSLWP